MPQPSKEYLPFTTDFTDHAPPSQAARAKLNRVPIDEVELQECLLGGLGFAHGTLVLL